MIHRRITESDKVRSLANAGKYRACFYYTAFLAYLDKAGRMNANPLLLKGSLFEGYADTVEEITAALHDLARVGLVRLYANGRHEYLMQYEKFLTEDGGFNTPHQREPASQLPGPDDDGSTVLDDPPDVPETYRTRTERVRPDLDLDREFDREVEGNVRADFESSEARTMHALTTGRSETHDAPRARAFFHRLIGKPNCDNPQARDELVRWYQDHTEDEIRTLWDRAKNNPENKGRLWWFIDALNGLKSQARPTHDLEDWKAEADATIARVFDDVGVN